MIAVEIGFRPEICEVNVATGIASNGNDLHSNHDRAGGVGAVR
jgi:hypothetical protein